MLVTWILLASLPSATPSQAKAPAVISSTKAGEITAPSAGWQIDFTNVYDDGTRPVLQLSNAANGITASIMLFDNYYKKVDSAGCRKDATDGILQNQAAAITDRKDFTGKAANGAPLAFTAWTLHSNPATIRQRNLFAFSSNAETCFEIHVSKMESGKPLDAELMRALLTFNIHPNYKPDASAYLFFATLLFSKSPGLAVPYYQQALKQTPASAPQLTMHRVIIDQLVMSLGRSGDLKQSRAVAQHAIESDPDYPINYYNLACADAEQGDAAQARVHLEQAFARKQNVIQGETMPDPSNDDSLLKLKSDAAFWSYVESLQ